MGVEVLAWQAVESQLLNDTTLSAFVNKYKFDLKEESFQPSHFPILQCFPTSIETEEYLAMPKVKIVDLEVEVHGKLFNSSNSFVDILFYSEMIKNALELDLQGGGDLNTIRINSTNINQLDDKIIEVIIIISAQTKKFTAGLR